jgi:hypothetical protein
MSKKPIWIHEKEAAAMIGYRPRVLRMYVKAGKLDIAYTNINGKFFQYNKLDIEKVLLDNSTWIR